MRAAVRLLRESAADEGSREAVALVTVRKPSVRSTRPRELDARCTQVLAQWLEDHSVYGVGEQGKRQ
jgi:hypothetical protein